MGTNYYATRGEERLHIGKSSGGWCFSLHIIPEYGLDDLDDWMEHLSRPDVRIEDEYGRSLDIESMLEVIINRGRADREMPNELWLRQNYAEPGPNGLVRHSLGRGCSGHGEGTWDLVPGEFS